jgi:hypothetical protein
MICRYMYLKNLSKTCGRIIVFSLTGLNSGAGCCSGRSSFPLKIFSMWKFGHRFRSVTSLPGRSRCAGEHSKLIGRIFASTWKSTENQERSSISGSRLTTLRRWHRRASQSQPRGVDQSIPLPALTIPEKRPIMSKTAKSILLLLMALPLCHSLSATQSIAAFTAEPQVSPAGRSLENMLDSMRVEERWLAGHHVNWKTGQPDGRPYLTKGAHTHCSAFVAAAASRLGIYLLRPPEHSQILLANAQVDWLQSEGSSQGWKEVGSGLEAQRLANEGFLVIAAYKTRNPDISGHIVIVRPYAKSEEMLQKEGPQVIQAARYNRSSTTLRRGFKYHPGAFEHGKIHFFAHAIPAERLERFRSIHSKN